MEQNNNCGVNGGLSAAFYTLGCRVNQYETQAIEEQFREKGFEIKSFDESCDVYVINTCTVTAESDRKSRQIIRRTAQVKKHSSVVVVCGCYSQGNPDAVKAIQGVDIILGNSKKSEIVDIALEYLQKNEREFLVEDISGITLYEQTSISSSDRTRAFVKIVDGCENHCTYCIIPSVRGKIRSRSSNDIIDEVKRLANAGYKEVVLTGIETAAYGKEFEKQSTSPLGKLIEQVAKVEGIERIRLGSMEPTVFTESFVQQISKVSKLMPHYHLSLQSGSDAVLAKMKRKYNTQKFREVIQRLRRYIPEVQITTDIIVGFPGETKYNFDETLNFTEECKFAHVHIFPYSRRSGTLAAKMPGQLDRATKKQRVSALELVSSKVRDKILNACIGTMTTVLLESEANDTIDGYTPYYIKVKIPLNGKPFGKSGCIERVVITSLARDDDGSACLMGKFIN